MSGTHEENLLIHELISGKEEAFIKVVKTYTDMLLHTAAKRVKDKAQAEDLVQDIFLKLWENRKKVKIGVSLEAYLRTCLKYRVIRLAYREKLREDVMYEMQHRVESVSDDGFNMLITGDLERVLEQVSSELPENMSKIFSMRQQGVSIKEISSKLNVAEQTVKNYYGEALRRFKEVILARYPDLNPILLSIIILELI